MEEADRVLYGDELKEAHANLIKEDEDDISEAQLEQDISFLNSELNVGEHRIEKLIEITNRLRFDYSSVLSAP